jgi:hypothetical protein
MHQQVFGDTESEIRKRIVGTWKLVSTEETLKDGRTRPFPQFGPHGEGLLMYQADGHMCAVMANPNGAKKADPAQAMSDSKVRADYQAFAYAGRYEIDGERKQIIHLPVVATEPSFIGSRQIRPYQFERERLIFSDVENNDPAVSHWKIIWEKVR